MAYAILATANLIGLYGLVTVYAGFTKGNDGEIPTWSALGMFMAGGMLVAAAVLLFLGKSFALPLLIVALLAIHGLTIYSGFSLHGKINSRHHIARLIISLVLIGLTYWSLNS